MHLQNRVDPWGNLHTVPDRGQLMGNRGILHDGQKQIVRRWKSKGWVTCLLEFRGRKREEKFSVGSYSELFFLDEATAFSAGHRPCSDCRRDRYKEFKAAWLTANSNLVQSENPPVAGIDEIIHRERELQRGGKAKYEAPLAMLPPGTMIEIDNTAFLVWRERLYRWSFDGYTPCKATPGAQSTVQVLTPASIVKVFEKGLVPQVHISAFQ